MPLSNEQYNIIEREYDRRRNRHAYEWELRRQKIYEMMPELFSLEEELSDLAFEAAKAAASGDRDRADELSARRALIVGQKRELLDTAGVDPADLEMQYDCPLCRDTGYIDGKPCECRRRAETALLYDQSRIRDILAKENFSTWREDIFSDQPMNDGSGRSVRDIMKANYAFVREFTDEFREKGGNLLLWGGPGTGKTFMTHCIAKELLDKSVPVVYLTAEQLFSVMAEDTFSGREDAAGKMDTVNACDLLIIDDLGTELTNRFTVSGLFNCLNERIIAGKSTVISTNLSLDDLRELYSERVTSRILGNFRIRRFPGDDLRPVLSMRAKAN